MVDAWLARPYENDDVGIFSLKDAISTKGQYNFGDWTNLGKWKYKDNPSGKPIIWVADCNGQIVGYYCIIPVSMKVNNDIIKCFQSVDTMTHPEYRHQGIFKKLALKTYEQAEKEGINLLYGFPNKYSYPGFINKLEWLEISNINTLIKPLNYEHILKLYVKNDILVTFFKSIVDMCQSFPNIIKKPHFRDDVSLKEVKSFDNRINDLWEEFSKDYELLVVRTKEYLNWRYVFVPNANYTIYIAEKNGKIYGYIVFAIRKQRNLLFGYIFDLVVPLKNTGVSDLLISKAMQELEDKNADLIFYQMIGKKPLFNVFKRRGFMCLNFIDKRFPFIVRMNENELPEEYIKNINNWFIQIGDSDFI